MQHASPPTTPSPMVTPAQPTTQTSPSAQVTQNAQASPQPPHSIQQQSRLATAQAPEQQSQAPQQQPTQQPIRQTAEAASQSHPQSTESAPNTATAAAATTNPTTVRQRLRASDQRWQWKIGLRAVLIVSSLIGIGCAAWATANYGFARYTSGNYQFDDSYSIPWSLVTFSITVVWCAVCMVVFFSRSSHSPVHPGAQVGVDLIFWLAYLLTGLLAVVAVTSVANIGSGGEITNSWSSSSDGGYSYIPSNDTWVWNATSAYTSSYYGYTPRPRSCNQTEPDRFATFATCADEDAYVNNLWTTRKQRYNVELVVVVLQFLNLLLHFILFVWACVDTHRRRTRKPGMDAEKIAADIVMKMIQTGAIIPAAGPAQMQPRTMGQMPGQYHPQMMPMYPQHFAPQFAQQQNQYPTQLPPPQQQLPPASFQPQHPSSEPPWPSYPSSAAQPRSVGNEKGESARFA